MLCWQCSWGLFWDCHVYKRWRFTIGGCITKGSCFFCSVELEHNMHQFLSCSMAIIIWRPINLVWMSLTGVNISSFSWVFAHMENNELLPHFQINFEFLMYCGLWFNWNMGNAFTFDLQLGVRKYVVMLKGLLLWQLRC